MKNLTKRILAATMAATMIIGGSMTAFAATAQDITAKNPTSYTAGTQSVYGPKLTQDQLNAVANVVADFKTNYTNDSMTNDQKIRAGYDYIKNRVAYIDWDKGVGANTAYALVTGQGACSGMTRGFIALMDSVDVKAYLIHANTNDHQWIMTEFDDGFAYIDIDANVSSGFEAIYHAKTHPYTYDTNGLPAVGSHSSGYGAKAAVAEGWKQDNTGWWYQNADGSYPVNAWKEINGKQYYFGSNGYMLENTTTPDGYKVGSDGAWVQQGQQSAANDGVHTKTFNDTDSWIVDTTTPLDTRYDTSGNKYYVIPEDTTSIKYLSEKSNLDPSKIKLVFTSYKYNPDTNTIYSWSNDGTAIYEDFKYDTVYDLKIPNVNLRGADLVNYCKQNNIMIRIDVNDKDDAMGARFLYCYK